MELRGSSGRTIREDGPYAPGGPFRVAASQGDLTISPFYHEAKNEIVQPAHFVACSRYFVRTWMPLLGGTATQLVLFLRSLGYYNPHTGERRDGVRVGMKELAAACGVSDRTIQRELDGNTWLRYFVRVESSYEQLPDGRVRHHENLYRIAMDDPLHPDDEPRLREIIAQRERSSQLPDPATADGRVKRGRKTEDRPRKTRGDSPPSPPNSQLSTPDSQLSTLPMNDILSPPPAAHGRQSVTRVASKCRLKESKDIQTQDIPSDIHNNPQPPSRGAVPVADPNAGVVAFVSLLSRLTECGVTRIKAEKLVRNFPEELILRQIEALPYREAKDPAAVLVKSIEEDWALPTALLEMQARVSRRSEERKRAAAEQAMRESEKAAESEMLSRLQSYWQELSPAEQGRVEAEARAALKRSYPFVAQLMDRAGEGRMVRATLESLRNRILSDRLGLELPD